ncbi:MAG TPA: triacylglycerol lipase [Moraxellaceae bacterium]|nr:triacylglycerol lipase [Moraxellaceae bacterium]
MKKLMAAALMLVAGVANAGTYSQTRYPIVLAPGVLGFDKVLGIEYFYGIAEDLSYNGAHVYTTSASAFNSSIVRGEELLSQVQTILAVSGAQKVNLIGHSHGGFSARYVAAVIPGQVASVTTMGSPTKGTPVGDLMQTIVNNPYVGGLAATIVNAFSTLLTTLAGNSWNEDFAASMASLSTTGAATFNASYPAGVPTTSCGEGAYTGNGGQRYYSMGGTSVVTNILDPLDTFFGVTSLAMNESNDGLVGRCSNHFGHVLRDNYPWNHGDEINHLFGLRGLFTPDPVAAYRDQANRLKNAGL